MLGDRLAMLDIPSDGSAKLVSVQVSTAVDGCKQWTIVFRETKGGGVTPAAPPPPPTSYRPEQPPPPAAVVSPSPTKAVAFAPAPTTASPRAAAMPLALTPEVARGKALVAAAMADAATTPTTPEHNKLMTDRIFPLKCQVKTYAWGKLGDEYDGAAVSALDENDPNYDPETDGGKPVFFASEA